MARISLTFVSVGPVRDQVAERVEQAVAVMRGQHAARRRAPRARARQRVGGQRARRRSRPCRRCRRCRRRCAQMPGAPSSAIARPSRNVGVAAALAAGVPSPMVTVVSPPDSSTAGARERLAVRAHRAGDAGHDGADLAASPSSASPRISGVRPSARAAAAAARSAIIGVAIMRKSACGRLPGFGVSSSSRASRAATAGGGRDAVARDQRRGHRRRWWDPARSGRSRSPPGRRPARR